MDKRNLATVLWFVAGWWGGALTVGLLGLPSILALLPGVVAAGLVRWDPTGAFWARSATERRILPIDEFAETLGDARRPTAESDRPRS